MTTPPQFTSATSKTNQRLMLSREKFRRVGLLATGILFGTIAMSANADSLISSTDYLDYELPKSVQEKCAERQNCPEIEVKYLKTNHDWINDITNARINNLVINSKPTESAPINIKATPATVKAAIDDFASSQFIDIPR